MTPHVREYMALAVFSWKDRLIHRNPFEASVIGPLLLEMDTEPRIPAIVFEYYDIAPFRVIIVQRDCPHSQRNWNMRALFRLIFRFAHQAMGASADRATEAENSLTAASQMPHPLRLPDLQAHLGRYQGAGWAGFIPQGGFYRPPLLFLSCRLSS